MSRIWRFIATHPALAAVPLPGSLHRDRALSRYAKRVTSALVSAVPNLRAVPLAAVLALAAAAVGRAVPGTPVTPVPVASFSSAI